MRKSEHYNEKLNSGNILCVPLSLVQVNGEALEDCPFEREREYILYSMAFRNLSAKTQVFHSDFNANLRTRLTHTLEVARIAVDMAEKMGFNVALTEAIALGHDLGHTPFGHVGERTIHKFSSGQDRKYTTRKGDKLEVPENLRGFKHNQQGVRVLVEYTPGCQFSNFILYGIRGHSSLCYKNTNTNEDGKTSFYDKYDKMCSVILDGERQIPAWSVEAFLVKWADEIAQRHHDIEDAYFQKIMSPKQIVELFSRFSASVQEYGFNELYSKMKDIAEKYDSLGSAERELFPRYLTDFVINVYVSNVIKEFQNCFDQVNKKYEITSGEQFAERYTSIAEDDIKKVFSLENTQIYELDKNLNKKLKYAILDSYEVQRLDGKSEYIVRRLLRAYKSNPQQLPNKYINHLMQVELQKLTEPDEYNQLLGYVKEKLGYGIEPKQVQKWQDYECRNALRIFLEDASTEKIILPALMRIVFDYIASMTDDFAYEEYKVLYE